MASKDFIETLVSHRQKELFIRLELMEYDRETKSFVKLDEQIVSERHLPDGIDLEQTGFDKTLEQDVSNAFSLMVVNHTGVNNWGADFDNNGEEFQWWLDKRMNVDLGLRLDSTGFVEFIRMGHYVITNFKSTHNLTEFPTTEIDAVSKEVMFASRRGLFLYPTTVVEHTNIVETIKTILKGGGEIDKNIHIDPSINDTHVDLENGESTYGWKSLSGFAGVGIDKDDKIHGDSSLKLTVNAPKYSYIQEKTLFRKTFDFPVDLRNINAMAVWLKSSTDLPQNALSIVLRDKTGKELDLPLSELVGHIVDETGEVVYIDNWRNCLLRVEDSMDIMSRVVEMDVRVNRTPFHPKFTFWIDQLYAAEIRNLLPYEISFGAGTSKWAAIKELAYLLDCRVFYDEWGHFNLVRNKVPKDRHEVTHEYFDYDVYEILVPKLTLTNKLLDNNIYAGGENIFEEHELANHIQVVGGSTDSSVTTLVDLALYDNGLHFREKGKVLNSRGKIRAIDQFTPDNPTILNEDTDVAEVWKGHENEEVVIEMYPDGFPHLTQPPINNFAVERIGDFIYHHNNANPDPLIQFTYEAKNRALWELRERLAYAEQIDILAAPFFTLKEGDIIRLEDTLLGLKDNFQIKSIHYPIDGSYMNLSVVKIRNYLVDVPYFDNSGLKHNACFYGYDVYDLGFTFPL